VQKKWKRIWDYPTHYCSMRATSTYRVCKETRWTSQTYPSETGRSSWLDCRQKPILQVHTSQSTGEQQFQAVLEPQHTYGWNNIFGRPDITFMNKKTKNTFLIGIGVPNTHNLAKTITDKQNECQELANEICAMWKQNAVQLIPIVI